VGIEVVPEVNPACQQDFSEADFWTAYIENGELTVSLFIPQGMSYAASRYSLSVVDAGQTYECYPLPDVPRRLYCHGYPPSDVSASEIRLMPEGEDCQIPLPTAHLVIPEPLEEDTCGEEPLQLNNCPAWEAWCACMGGTLEPEPCGGDECVCLSGTPCCWAYCKIP
jgi:hypothetical protein